MADPKLPAAKRRLNALLRDEEYGPKLVRLSRKDERVVLDLVYEGKGREARKAIVEFDRERRAKRTFGGKAREYASLPRRTRSARWSNIREEVAGFERQFWSAYRAAVLAR